MRVRAVDLALCTLPLDKPFRLGGVEIATRDYVAVRLIADTGIEGFALGYRSNTAVVDVLAHIGPRLIGADPIVRRAVADGLEQSGIQGRAMSVRARSLFDIALWDLAGKAAGVPLYHLLGGVRRRVAAVPVAGFSYQDRSPHDLEGALRSLLDAGFRTIKIVLRGGDDAENVRHAERMALIVRDRGSLIVDLQWAYRHVADALTICRALDDLGLYCLEDPFLPQQWRLAAELRQRIRTPIAVGEDVVDTSGFLDLVQAVDILRVDATASGGITGALTALEIAHAHGRRVLPHVFPYLHLQLACAHPSIVAVEFVPPETGTDPVRSLLRSFPTIENGDMVVSEDPGVGVALDWDAVASRASVTKRIA
jgi:L-alanine-DL-glutamate epimerase-like enolase superfamily enzyme